MPSKKRLVVFVASFSIILGSLAITTPLLAAGKEKVLYSFCSAQNCTDGSSPNGGLIFDNAGDLYGTTLVGGGLGDCTPGGCGTVFKLIPNNGRWTEEVLYGFNSQPPNPGLVFDNRGNIYGTTNDAGKAHCGTAFELIPNNHAQWTEKVLYTFTRGSDGCGPLAGLIFDRHGNLYGTTARGGSGVGFGTVFELTRNNGKWREKVLYAFTGGKDGNSPYAGLTIDSSGNLYGTTSGGGDTKCLPPDGCGTIFELISDNGKWTEKVLHAFTGKDGQHPQDNLVFDSDGNIYSTASYGGAYKCRYVNCGTAFELTFKGGRWTEEVLHSFNGKSDGAYPENMTFDRTGKLYGTTYGGGAYGYGTVFELLLNNGRWMEKVLNNFNPNGHDGANPYPGGLILDTAGNLYGTTVGGGTHNYGTVFEVKP
jgi:uncharacterized repeat protein (TIGR03803 family)